MFDPVVRHTDWWIFTPFAKQFNSIMGIFFNFGSIGWDLVFLGLDQELKLYYVLWLKMKLKALAYAIVLVLK